MYVHPNDCFASMLSGGPVTDPDCSLQELCHLDFTSILASCLNVNSIASPPSNTFTNMAAKKSEQKKLLAGNILQLPMANLGSNTSELGLHLVDLFGFKNEGLNTPPVAYAKGEQLAYPEQRDESGIHFGEEIFGEGEGLLDPDVENSVNLNDLLETCGQDGFDKLFGIDQSASTAQEGDACHPLIKVEPRVSQQFSYEEAVSPVTLNADECFLPLPVVEELAGEEICCDEQQYDESSIENIITIHIEDLSALSSSGCFIQAIEVPKTEILQPVSTVVTPTAQIEERKSVRNSLKAPTPSSKSRTSGRQRLSSFNKESDEYRDKRDRNNASVRKSRDKARQKQEETESRVQVLSDENQRLQEKVDSLEKELSILRGLFTNVGADVPHEVKGYVPTNRKL